MSRNRKSNSKFVSGLVFMSILILFPAGWAPAEEEGQPEVITAPQVVVKAKAVSPATGESTISDELLENLPAGNGSINEMLKVLPDVQFSEESKSALTGGEIAPPNLSISGGRFYDNNFSIDGVSNNSLLDPAADNPMSMNDVPGNPQEVFLDADLIKSIKVYDSNVPAKYGGFTGGYVDAETKRAGGQFSGSVKYRTTRSEWATFHLEDGDVAEWDFLHSNSHSMQPVFEKHDVTAIINAPIGDDMGILGSYTSLWSDIPLVHLGGSKTQTRRNENIFAKYSWDVTARDCLDVSVAYAPYEGKYFIKNAQNSDFVIRGGGFRMLADLAHDEPGLGLFKTQLSYRESENTRESPRHWRLWATTDTFPWGAVSDSETSGEGGFGDITKTMKSMTVKLDADFAGVSFAWGRHRLNSGFEYERTEGTFVREDTTYVYKDARISPDIECDADCIDCVAGEQFFTTRNVYPKDEAEAGINLYALYLSDKYEIWRLTLSPGIRIGADDYMDNVDVAPRFLVSLDIFGTGATTLHFGANRYYSRALLTYKLREAQAPYWRETRTSYHNQLTAWQKSSVSDSSDTRYSELKTPYSDELAGGLDQSLFGGRFSVKFVNREGRDEFARQYGPVEEDGLRYYTLNNRGESSHQSLRVSWERSWRDHFLSMSLNWQESRTTNPDYDTSLEEDEADSRIWYKNKLIYLSELPASNYNRPFIAKLTFSGRLPWGITFTNHTSYRAGYRAIEDTGDTLPLPDGEGGTDPMTGESLATEASVYDEITYDDVVIFDWSLSWAFRYHKNQTVTFTLEVENVFDAESRVGSSATEYEMGRLFWAGAKWSF